MRYFLCCVALLCAVGCSSVPSSAAPQDTGDQWKGWIPGFCNDAWETFDANAGLDYQLGAHVKFTNLASLGIFDYADFNLVGLDTGIFNGDWEFPDLDPRNDSHAWDLSFKAGMGFGMDATLHTWEVVDFLSSFVGLGYWSLDED